MRHTGEHNRRLAPVVAGVLVAAVTVMSAGSPAVAATACTYNAQPAPLTAVAPGMVVAVACSGLAPSQQVVINEESPLAFIVQPSTSAPFEQSTGTGVIATADGTGNLAASFTIPAAFVAADAFAACPPTQLQVNAGLASCSLTLRDSATSALLAPQAALVYAGQPTPTVAPTVTIVNGASFVAGDIVTFAGSGFWGAVDGTAPTVQFGSTVAAPSPQSPVAISPTTYVCATDCNGSGSTLAVGGAVSGSVVVPSGVGAGLATVSVLQTNETPFPGNGPLNTVSASTQATILGAPDAIASPNSGGPGTPVQVTGTGWDPQGPAPVMAFLTPATSGGTTDSAAAFVDANGNLAGVLTVTSAEANGVNPIVVTQGALTAQAAFTVSDITTTCVGTSCTNNQVLTQTIGQGDLTLAEQSFNVALGPITLNGTSQHSVGQLNAVTVTDDRGTLVGWTVTGTLEGDFVNQSAVGNTANNYIPAANLTWTPAVSLTFAGSGDLTQVTAGPVSPLSKTTGVTLCSAATGGGGGSYDCTAAVDLFVPASVAAGTYTAVLDVVIT